MFFLDVFPAALFVHELDKHELFGVHIVGHTLWCGTIIVVVVVVVVVFTNFIVNNIMTLQHKQ